MLSQSNVFHRVITIFSWNTARAAPSRMSERKRKTCLHRLKSSIYSTSSWMGIVCYGRLKYCIKILSCKMFWSKTEFINWLISVSQFCMKVLSMVILDKGHYLTCHCRNYGKNSIMHRQKVTYIQWESCCSSLLLDTILTYKQKTSNTAHMCSS